MADFKKVLKAANDGYHDRKDYPRYSIDPMDGRNQWNKYLEHINYELNDLEAQEDTAQREFDWLTTTDLMMFSAAIQAAVNDGYKPENATVLWEGAVTLAEEIRRDFVLGEKPEREGV